MKHPKTLSAFSPDEFIQLHRLLATKVAMMMGRKFEEDDWMEAYCAVKGIPYSGWSNLHIDIMHEGLGVEHKQLKVTSKKGMRTFCGERKMHPSLTRSIRIPTTDIDPNEAMRDILQQYADLIKQREEMVRKAADGNIVDMRSGWLLWQDSLEEFLYFEEEMLQPDFNDYYAEWQISTSASARKDSTNLWIYERDTGVKRYSVTTSAGAKIQGYFDIPPPNDPNVYIFRVQGELIEKNEIRLWVTPATRRELEAILGTLDKEILSNAILSIKDAEIEHISEGELKYDLAVPLSVTDMAYKLLKNTFHGVSDEHLIRLLIEYLRSC